MCKVKQVCHKSMIAIEDLVNLKFSLKSKIAGAFLISNVKSLRNNYNEFYKFLGIFFFSSSISFTLKEALKYYAQ